MADKYDKDDGISEELPTVVRMLGPSVIPILQTYLGNPDKREGTRIDVTDCLRKMGIYYPEACQQCAEILTKQLQYYNPKDWSLNGFLIVALVDLEAKESAPVIQFAYLQAVVDETISGDLETVLVEMGAIDPSPEYLERKHQEELYFKRLLSDNSDTQVEKAKKLQLHKLKSKKKQEKQARKKNRRK